MEKRIQKVRSIFLTLKRSPKMVAYNGFSLAVMCIGFKLRAGYVLFKRDDLTNL